MALPGKKFNISHRNEDNNEPDDLSLILSSLEESLEAEDIDDDEDEDVFTGFNEVKADNDNNVLSVDDDFSLDFGDDLDDAESFFIDSVLPDDIEDVDEDVELDRLLDYQQQLDDMPVSNHNVRKVYDKTQELDNVDLRNEIDNVTERKNSLTSQDYQRLTVHKTIHNVDMVNKGDKSGTPLSGSHVNRATKKRIYDRNGRGVLSPAQIQYFTSLSKTNLSNARYPEEYVNLIRSNEELLDSGQRLHKRVVKDFISNGIDKDSRKYVEVQNTKSISWQDEELLEIIARLKYASTIQLSRATSRPYDSINKSLRGLKHKRLVKNPDSPYYNQRLWCLSEIGMMVSNFDLTVPELKGISTGALQHTTVVNNIAAFVHSGTVNVLNLEEFPPRNRVTAMGRVVAGDDFVSETQLRSSLGKMVIGYNTSGTKGDVYIPIIKAEIDSQFDNWRLNNSPDNPIHSPEREYGNEYMWVLYPPPYLGIVQHIPDLVIPRDRDINGKPKSIAVEIELKPKPSAEYERTLKAYEDDDRLYEKVIWICNRKRTANLLLRAAQDATSLLDDGRLEVVPIETENGVFKGTNVLALG